MTLVNGRARAMTQKQTALSRSLEAWLAATAGQGTKKDPAYEIHYVQTREVDQMLAGLKSMTAMSVAAADANNALRRKAENIETTMLATCQVWEFFRSRFAQRLDPALSLFLRIADELAWQCYRPIRDFVFAGSARCKAPPLVYLNSVWSPFTVVRDRQYQAESVPQAFLRDADFNTALSRMPFPVIAVPWYQTVYLPDAISICHEVGHSIEADFGLEKAIAAAVAAAIPDGDRRELWTQRGSELFADYFACLAVGEAYPWALANILLADADILLDTSDAKYPSRFARLLFNARVLERIGFADGAKRVSDAWEPLADAADVDAAEVAEARLIADRFASEAAAPALGLTVTNPKGEKKSLRELIGLTAAQQAEADADVEKLKAAETPSSAEIRVLFAAAALVWRDQRLDQAELMKVMRAACVDERRNTEARLPAALVNERHKRLMEEGATLAATLLAAAPPNA
jgi:hypothetical protein